MQPSSGDPDLTYTGAELRNLIRSLLSHSDGFAPQQGVLGGTNGALGYSVSAGSGFNVTVPAGRALIQDDDVTNGGTAICWNDASVTLAVPTPPSSGTSLHRVVLQLRNKLENGTWTTYDFLPVLVPDATPGDNTLPAEPNSAITLASVSIPAGASSVSAGGTITDLRESASTVAVCKAGNTSTKNTTMVNDPDLQLNNLASSATYEFYGVIFYNGGAGASETDIQAKWNTSNATLLGAQARLALGGGGGTPTTGFTYTDSTSPAFQAFTNGTGTIFSVMLMGTIVTGAAGGAQNFARFAWGTNTNTGTNTTVVAGSFLRARRIL